MNIGIDIDEVLCKTNDSFLKAFNKKHNTNIKRTDIFNYDYSCVEHFQRGYILSELIKHLELNLNNFEIVVDAKNVLKKLKNKGYKLYVITARNKELVSEKTIDWLNFHFGENFFEKILFSNEGKNMRYCKSEITKKYNIDILIEDEPNYATNCAELGIKVFLMDCPWNKKVVESNNLTRIYNWIDIENLLLNEMQQLKQLQ
ncbi:MAG: 5' nucleotidase, NT5C type [Nanoarchaeota archaeon]